MKTKWKIIVFCVIWAAFFAFGIYLRTLMPWDRIANLHGLDYIAHGMFFSDYRRIFMPAFRHPFLAFITAPLPLFGGRLLEFGQWPYWCFLFAVFSAVMAGAVMLVYHTLKAVPDMKRIDAAAGTALFLSFSYTWLLAACPESFPLACAAGLLVLRWGLSPSSSHGKVGRLGWFALAVLNGGITTTNVVKVVLAFLAARGITRRRLLHLAAMGALLALVVLLAMCFRYFCFNITHDASKEYFSDGMVKSTYSFVKLDLGQWLNCVWNFFSEPIATHGDALSVYHLKRPYCSLLMPFAVIALYAAAAIGAWRARRQPLVKMVLAMIIVDIVLHIVMKWGLDEGHIYCGHWLYTPAILAAMLPATCTGKARKIILAGLFVLASTIFISGVYAFATTPNA